MQVIFLQTPEPGVRLRTHSASPIASNNVTLYGLYYPGIGNCVSWCYLTIAPDVIITTHLPTDGGTSITNSWSVAFLDKLKKLGPVAVAGNVRWFEHYHRQKSKGGWNIGASLGRGDYYRQRPALEFRRCHLETCRVGRSRTWNTRECC